MGAELLSFISLSEAGWLVACFFGVGGSLALLSVARLSRALKQHERKEKCFHECLNRLPIPIWVKDAEGKRLFVNERYAHLAAGSTRAIAKTDITFLPELYATAGASDQTIAKQDKAVRKPFVLDNIRHIFQLKELPIEACQVTVGFGLDVTDSDELAEELRQHVSHHSNFLESLGTATAMFDQERRIVFYNQAYIRLWGLDEQWLHNKPKYEEILDRLRALRKLPEQDDFKTYRRNQIQLFTEVQSDEPYNEFMYFPNGNAYRVIILPSALGGLLFTYEDMTDRLRLERAINTLNIVQRITLDHLEEGVLVFSQDGRVTLCNDRYASIWNIDKKIVEARPHISEIFEENKSYFQDAADWEAFRNSLVSPSLGRGENFHRLDRIDGSVIDARCVPLPDSSMLIIFADVTDTTLVERSLRERNDALVAADRLKSQFLANVSYELRSPLTTIVGYAEAIKTHMFGPLNDKQQEYMEGLFQSSQYLLALINDILDLASIEAGYMKLDITAVSVYDLLEGIYNLMKERVQKEHLSLQLDCSKHIGTIRADHRRVKQLIFKLLSNAIKYTELGKAGTIILSAYEEGRSRVVMSVSDTGIGMSLEEQERIFDKFYQGQYKGTRSGAGLGLSVAKEFVELHGGSIRIESEPGRGTTVMCSLPRDNPAFYQSTSLLETAKA